MIGFKHSKETREEISHLLHQHRYNDAMDIADKLGDTKLANKIAEKGMRHYSRRIGSTFSMARRTMQYPKVIMLESDIVPGGFVDDIVTLANDALILAKRVKNPRKVEEYATLLRQVERS